MNIAGLNISQIGKKMEPYLAEYFEGYTIHEVNGIFSEVILFAYDEISHLLIHPDDNQLFVDDDWFTGASGYIVISSPKDSPKNYKEIYVVSLIMNDSQTQALFLYVTKWIDTIQSNRDELVKNFTQQKEAI